MAARQARLGGGAGTATCSLQPTAHFILLPPAPPPMTPLAPQRTVCTSRTHRRAVSAAAVAFLDGQATMPGTHNQSQTMRYSGPQEFSILSQAPLQPPVSSLLQPRTFSAGSTVTPPSRPSPPQLKRPSINKVAAKMLTQQIRSCETWAQLETLFTSQKDQLNVMNMLALINQLTKVRRDKTMTRYEDSAAALFVTQLVEHTLDLQSQTLDHRSSQPYHGSPPQPHHDHLHWPPQHQQHSALHRQQHWETPPAVTDSPGGQQQGLSLRALANMVWACGKLEMSPGLVNVNALLSRMLPLLQAPQGCDPASLSQTLWGLARLGHTPSSGWMNAYLGAVEVSVDRAEPQALSNILWALAKLKVPLVHLARALPALLSSSLRIMERHTPQALANTAWALTELGCYPGDEWMAKFWQCTDSLSRADVALRPVDMAHWVRLAAHVRPMCATPHGWVDRQLQRTLRQPIQSQELTMILMSCCWLGHRLPDWWLSRVTRPGVVHMANMQAQEASNLVYALAKQAQQGQALDIHRDFVHRWFQMGMACMPYFNARDCASVVLALGTLSWRPSERWLAAIQEASFEQLPHYTGCDVAGLMRGWVKLQASPPRVWLERFFLQTVRQLPVFSTPELCSLLASLAASDCRPPQQWMSQWLNVALLRLPHLNGQELASTVKALRRLSYQPSPTWTQALLQCVDAAAQRTLTKLQGKARHKFASEASAASDVMSASSAQALQAPAAQSMTVHSNAGGEHSSASGTAESVSSGSGVMLSMANRQRKRLLRTQLRSAAARAGTTTDDAGSGNEVVAAAAGQAAAVGQRQQQAGSEESESAGIVTHGNSLVYLTAMEVHSLSKDLAAMECAVPASLTELRTVLIDRQKRRQQDACGSGTA